MKYLDKLQNLLPLGYLYLIVLGLIKETLLFSKLGINIIKYSSITDVLISPIADITSKLSIFIAVASFILILTLLMLLMVKNSDKKWVQKITLKKGEEGTVNKTIIVKKIYKIFLVFVSFELFALFIGLGIGQGDRLTYKIKNNQIEYNYELNFSEEGKELVYLIDVNSAYYFYITKGDNRIKIAPVGSIKNLVLIQNEN